MELISKNVVEMTLDTAGLNKIVIENTLKGGSADEFEPSEDAPTAAQFYIKDFEQKVFELSNGNTFSKNVLDNLETPLADITGIVIQGYYVEETKKGLPIRFKIAAKMTGMASAISMGSASNFSIMNIEESEILELNISEVIVPEEQVGNLVVLIFSKTINQ